MISSVSFFNAILVSWSAKTASVTMSIDFLILNEVLLRLVRQNHADLAIVLMSMINF